MNTTEAQAVIKGACRKLDFAVADMHKLPMAKTKNQWIKRTVLFLDTIFGKEYLLQNTEVKNPRTKKLLRTQRLYLKFNADCSACVICVLMDAKKRTWDIEALLIDITKHALTRVIASPSDTLQVILSVTVCAMEVFDDSAWKVGYVRQLYCQTGMFPLLKTLDDDGLEQITILTFIGADSFEDDSAHAFHCSAVEPGGYAITAPRKKHY